MYLGFNWDIRFAKIRTQNNPAKVLSNNKELYKRFKVFIVLG